MKFLIYFTTLNYKTWNSMAIHLKRIYPESQFAGIISAHGAIKGFLENQTDLKYEFLYEMTDIEKKFLKKDIDYKEIGEFEETTKEKSIWRFIAVDRTWGYPFSKGYLPVKYISKNKISHENVLRVVGGYIKYFKNILSEFDPDIVVFMLGMQSMMAPIFEQSCKNRNIPFIQPAITKIQNYFTFTTNKEIIFNQINDTYRKIMNGDIFIDSLSPGEKCYEEMFFAFKSKKNTYYFDQGSIYIEKLIKNRASKQIYSYLEYLKVIITTFLHWHRMRLLEKEKRKELNGDVTQIRLNYSFKELFYFYYYNLYKTFQVKKLSKKSFYDKYDPNEKYLYFPLHVTPEYAIQVRANIWINQLYVIEILAKSIPFDWKIYVKEHPGQIGWRVRPFSFYKEIKKYTNVKLIPSDMDNHQVISNAQLVVSIVGTPAWEAILFHGKPVITFSDDFYGITNLAKKVDNIVELSEQIHNEVKRIKSISSYDRKKRIICLLNAIIMNSFWAEKPLIILGEDPNPLTEEEIRTNGEILSNAIKKYIESH